MSSLIIVYDYLLKAIAILVLVFGAWRLQFTTLDIFGNFSSNYNYIDSSIVQAMVIDGLLYYLFFAIYGVQKSIDYFIQLKKEIVVVGMVVMVIHSMFDPQLFVLLYSPLLLMISRIFRVEVEESDVVGMED